MQGKHIIGDQFEYRTDDLLGQGSFGDVYKGQNITTKEIVAIKVIEKSRLKRYGTGIIKAIGNEVTILQRIAYSVDSPYVVKIHQCLETELKIYIILELCNGGSLQDILTDRKQLPEQEAKQIIYQVVNALVLLAQNNIAHRDMKPDNIFIQNGVYKLGDFGFASEKQMFETQCGTLPYMAPEMIDDDNYTNKVDIWALGVIYHQMLFGYNYFFKEGEDGQATVKKNILNRQYIIPSSPMISNESKEFLQLCLKKNPHERASALELINLKLFAGMSPLQSKILNQNTNSKVFTSEYTTPQPIAQSNFNQQAQSNFSLPVPTATLDSILDKIMNYRNGIFFLEHLAEQLTQNLQEETRFLIFYLLNKAMKLLESLREGIQSKECPKKIVGNEPLWGQFLGSEDQRKLKLYIENDYLALNSLYDQYLRELNDFIDKNYQLKANEIKAIINKDLSIDLSSQENKYFNYSKEITEEELKCKKMNFMMRARNDNEWNLYVYAYEFFLVLEFEDILKKQFSFEKYSEKKEKLELIDYLDLVNKEDYSQFIQL